MPRDLFLQKLDLDLVYPPFLERLLHVKAMCALRGARYISVSLWRSWGESHQLYLAHLKGGPRAAPAGASAHNYGLASDEALIIREPSPAKRVTSAKPEDFKILVEEAQKVGLHCGMKNDMPHVGWPGFVTGLELRPLSLIWTTNGNLPIPKRLRLVWDHVDANSPKLPPLVNS